MSARTPIQKPLWTLLFATIMLVDFVTLPFGSRAGSLRAWEPSLHRASFPFTGGFPAAALYDRDGTFAARPVHSGADGMLGYQPQGRLIGFARIPSAFGNTGWWREVEARDDCWIEFVPASRLSKSVDIPAERLQEARRAVVGVLIDADSPRAADAPSLIQHGVGGTRSILWSGVALNLLSLVNAAALVVSLGWLTPLLNFTARRRRRRWSQGRCVHCNYDLSQMPRGENDAVRCSECGTTPPPQSP